MQGRTAALPILFRHFIEQVRDLTGSVYGRRMYEVSVIGTKTIRSGSRRNMTSRRRGGANRSGSCRAR
jgi:hypothetical protein